MTVYLLCYAAAVLFAESGHYYLSGAGLLSAAVYLYLADYRRTGNMLHLRAVFSLAFVGGEGLACLKLSRLSTHWSLTAWLCFLAAYVGFYAVFQYLESREKGRTAVIRHKNFEEYEKPLFFCAFGITAVSLGCFVLEAAALGYVPLFVSGVPHAYSAFHLTGIHYFTVSCVLVPAVSVLYFCIGRGRDTGRSLMMAFLDLIALSIPILCVSRFQLLFAVLLAVVTYILIESRLNLLYALGALAALIPLYILLTMARSHDASYLSAVFDMKREGMPIFVTQPYMYIAHNYDNFNFLVEELAAGAGSHTWGIRSLAPFWTLTGLKFAVPSLALSPLFVIKEELTTLTLFYDAYYDFGLAGVLVFSGLLGAVSYYLTEWIKKVRNPAAYLFYAQMAIYLMLSFFTTWFSNPTTWFYLAVTAAAAFALSRRWG